MRKQFTPVDIEEIIKLAWADDISFATITKEYGLTENEVVKIMRAHQHPKTYTRWRKRITRRTAKQNALHK